MWVAETCSSLSYIKILSLLPIFITIISYLHKKFLGIHTKFSTYDFWKYRVILKSLRYFRPLRYSSRDGHAEWGACQQRDRHSKFVSCLTGSRNIHPWFHVCGRNLITGLTSAASPKVDISSTCKVGQKLRVSLPLLTCSPSTWPYRLLYRRGRNSRRNLWIILYISYPCEFISQVCNSI